MTGDIDVRCMCPRVLYLSVYFSFFLNNIKHKVRTQEIRGQQTTNICIINLGDNSRNSYKKVGISI